MPVVLQELSYDNSHNQAECYQNDVCKCFHSLKQGYNHSENLFQKFPEKFKKFNPVCHNVLI